MAVLCWSSLKEIAHIQGKRNPSKMVGVARGHQRADTLKPYSQKTSQSNHTMTRPSWVAPQAWLSFIELDKAEVLVWLDWLVFCEYDFSVSALWCPLATPTILLGFLLPWAWGISSWLLQQSTAIAPYLGRGVSLLTMPKPLTVWITINCGKFFKRWEYQTTWPVSWETYMKVRNQQLELDMDKTGSK